jgi:hypothetical protein
VTSSSVWFQSTLRYEGACELSFEDGGKIVGSGLFEVDQDLRSRIDFIVTAIDCGRPLPFPLSFFQTVPAGTVRTIPDREEARYADRFSLTTAEGVVHSLPGKVYFSASAHFGETTTITVHVYPGTTEFVARDHAPDQYVVAPLVNYVAPWITSDRTLDKHPLRLLRTISLPPDLADKYPELVAAEHRRLNAIVRFDFRGTPAFIQPLPTFEDVEAALENGACRARVTAMIVGETGGLGPAAGELLRWFPLDLAALLGLATGVEVDLPWVELRARDGSLVRRVHLQGRPPSYEQGTRYLDERSCHGTGDLVSVALRSPDFGKSHIRVALHALRSVQGHTLRLDSGLRDLLVALEALALSCTSLRRSRRPKLAKAWASRARAILATASSQLGDLAQEAATKGTEIDGRRIQKVAAIVRSEPLDQVGLSEKLAGFLDALGLPDRIVLDPWFQSQSRWQRDWLAVLVDLRARVVHRGVAGAGEEHLPIDEAVSITRHLEDLVLRVVFRLLGYSGLYQPPLGEWRTQRSVDWVTPTTTPGDLGLN